MADRDKPRGDRPSGGKPSGGRPGGSRPGGRPGGAPGGSRPAGGRPGGGYASGGRPSGSRPTSSRPPGDRPRYDKPRSDRPRSDAPRSGPPRPPGAPGDQRRPDYRSGSLPTDRKPYGDRPRKPPYGSFERPRYDDRPRTDERPRSDERPPRYEDRPRYDVAPRPAGPRPGAPRHDGPRDGLPRDVHPRAANGRFERRPDRPYGDRPRRPPFDARRPYTSRPNYDARPNREPPVDRDALVGEGEELIAGRRPVEEAFAARRDAIRLLIVPERRAALDALAIHATTLRIPVVEVEGGSLTALAGFDGHQGVALVARPREAGSVEKILTRARERGEAPFVLVLDSLEDPQNFGTLLRSAEACGVHGVIYPTRRSAPLSPAAIKASAGATEHLILAAVDDLAGTLADMHGDGLRIVGADEGASLSYVDADLRGPLTIVVGSEGRGMSGPVRRRLDLALRIPMRGKIESLNAAVAGSILLFAAAGQRPEPTPFAEAAPPRESEPRAEVGPESEAEVPAPALAADESPADEELLPGDA